jgi:SAM-dependent methyltransferase
MIENYTELSYLRSSIGEKFPYLTGVFQRQYDKFGDEWAAKFNKELKLFFAADEERIKSAAVGYGAFCLDSMKLQVEFNKTRQYKNKTYEEAASEVYQNENYMFGLYLPGILISHYLWKHHYEQLQYYETKLLPMLEKIENPLIYDVGPGTGFYTKEYLKNLSSSQVVGFDMSPHSLKHTEMMVENWGFMDRYESRLGNILSIGSI